MKNTTSARRTYGTGSLIVKGNTYYGKWRGDDGRQVMRKLGPKRTTGSSDGLTRAQAEARLRKEMTEVQFVAPAERVTFADAGQRHIEHLEHVMGRKPSTLGDYRSYLRKHLGPYFGTKPIARISRDDVEQYQRLKGREGLSTKTISNQLTFAHGVFRYAIKHGLAGVNPVEMVDRPQPSEANKNFRYLDPEQFELLLEAITGG